MPEEFYKEALKRGQKEKRHLISRGQYPYLPVMEDMMSKERFNSGVKLGVMQIPTEFIVGTKTEGRTNAFAANFMPLLDSSTEFAVKWKCLCQSHLEEGIREPVKLYEYMNRFYVEEGNKRVSVLKFFGAAAIPAQVIRILPPKGEEPELKLYYEFLDFYKCTKVNYIEFSTVGSYSKLQKLLGKSSEELWSEEEISSFRANYYYFKQMFESLGGINLQCTIGDAFLSYINIYGYASFKEKSGTIIKEEIQKIWEELELLQEDDAIDLQLRPEETRKPSFFEKLFADDPGILHAAFIHDKNSNESGWTYGHELGRQHVEKVFNGKIKTEVYEYAMDAPEDVIEHAIMEGNKVIFTTSPKLLQASLSAAVKYPDRLILNCSLNKPHRYIRTYYARMYEAKFIIGAIAGTLADNDRVGYLCDYPIYGQIAGINAFALGVQMVNPRAKVYLEWSCVDGVHNALCRLRERGITLISSHDLEKTSGDDRRPIGLFRFDEKGQTNIAMPVWHWGVYYEKLIHSILNRTMQVQYENSNKALNYYWGMSAGVVELIYSKNLPEGIKKLAKLLETTICSGVYNPFCGPFEIQSGEILDKEGMGVTLENIITMNWLLANVQGAIPEFEQLNDDGKEIVNSAGAPELFEEKMNEDTCDC